MANKRRMLWIGVSVAMVALVLLGAWLIQRVLPPTSIRIATGPEGEHDYRTALLYKQYIENEGVAVELVPTAGSLEVMEQLQAGTVDAGFVLNASNLMIDDLSVVTSTAMAKGLVGIAATDYIPQWIFYRSELEVDGPFNALDDLKGLRVAMDEPKSGTRAIANFLLRVSDIGADDLTVVDATPDEGADLLLAGDVDAMFLTSGFDSPTVGRLLVEPDVEILNLELAPTYARMISLFEEVVFLRGSVSISSIQPSADKRLLAVTSVLASKADFSPDIQILLTRAAREADQLQFDPFGASQTFPTVEGMTLPASEVTSRFINEGVTFLERYLPFWIASPLERFYVLILPLALLLYPVISNSPMAYGWMIRRRFYPWYKRLRDTELAMKSYRLEQVESLILEFDGVHRQLNELLNVPPAYVDAVYNLRFHIELLLVQLRKRRTELRVAAGHESAGATAEDSASDEEAPAPGE